MQQEVKTCSDWNHVFLYGDTVCACGSNAVANATYGRRSDPIYVDLGFSRRDLFAAFALIQTKDYESAVRLADHMISELDK